MTSEDFRDWMAHMGLSYRAAARELGVSPATAFDWLSGISRTTGKPVSPDRRTALACSALAAGLGEWRKEVRNGSI